MFRVTSIAPAALRPKHAASGSDRRCEWVEQLLLRNYHPRNSHASTVPHPHAPHSPHQQPHSRPILFVCLCSLNYRPPSPPIHPSHASPTCKMSMYGIRVSHILYIHSHVSMPWGLSRKLLNCTSSLETTFIRSCLFAFVFSCPQMSMPL